MMKMMDSGLKFGRTWVDRIMGKVDKDQGVANAGKVLGIGDDGQVVPVEQSGGGGSYTPYTTVEEFSAENLMSIGIKKGDIIKIPAGLDIRPSYHQLGSIKTLTLDDSTAVYVCDNKGTGSTNPINYPSVEMYFYVTEITAEDIYGICPVYGGTKVTDTRSTGNISIEYDIKAYYKCDHLHWLDNGSVQVPYVYADWVTFTDTDVINSALGATKNTSAIDMRGKSFTLYRF